MKLDGAEGAFIGRLRSEVETVSREMAAACCYSDACKKIPPVVEGGIRDFNLNRFVFCVLDE